MDTQQLPNDNCINLITLCEKNPELANKLVNNTYDFPSIYFKSFSEVPYVLFKDSVVRSATINKIIGIKGTIIKTGPVLLKNTKFKYKCLKCNYQGHAGDFGNLKCPSVCCDACNSSSIMKSECLNEAAKTQTIRVQNMGDHKRIANLYEISIEGEMAGKFHAGQEIVACGIVKVNYKPFRANEYIQSSLYIHCVYISKLESDEEIDTQNIDEFSDFLAKDTFDKRKFLISSFSEEIYGHSNIKLGLLLVIGNQYKEESKGTHNTRQVSHILLLGDAGTAKSHFLKVCLKLVSPSIMTNGVGTSNAGLTSCAVKQGKEWALEAGALLLADQGVCCIDEFNKLKVNEKGGLLEAMEQQTLSIAKAGILSSLNARCSIIAACSTKNYYDRNKNVSENTSISTPLVSRFDLIFGLFNICDIKKNEKIADTILQRINCNLIDDKSNNTIFWNVAKLKKYLGIVRKKEVTIDEKNSKVLLNYYLSKKLKDTPNEFNTLRMLESLVRLTETHAKLLGKKCVEEEDVISIILLFETTINSTSRSFYEDDNLFTCRSTYNKASEQIRKKFLLNIFTN